LTSRQKPVSLLSVCELGSAIASSPGREKGENQL
jgi:hypothetical protein